MIPSKELNLVKKRLAKKDVQEGSEVERKGKYLIIYKGRTMKVEGLLTRNDFNDILKNMGIRPPTDQKPIEPDYDYEKVFHLTLEDKEERLFTLERGVISVVLMIGCSSDREDSQSSVTTPFRTSAKRVFTS